MKNVVSLACVFLVMCFCITLHASPLTLRGKVQLSDMQDQGAVESAGLEKTSSGLKYLQSKQLLRKLHGVLAAGVVLLSMFMQPAFAQTSKEYAFENRSSLPVLIRELSERCNSGICSLFLADAILVQPGETYEFRSSGESRMPSLSVSSPGVKLSHLEQMDRSYVGYGNCYHSKAFTNQAVCQLTKKSTSRADSLSSGELIHFSEKSYQQLLERLGSATFYSLDEASDGITVRDYMGELLLENR